MKGIWAAPADPDRWGHILAASQNNGGKPAFGVGGSLQWRIVWLLSESALISDARPVFRLGPTCERFRSYCDILPQMVVVTRLKAAGSVLEALRTFSYLLVLLDNSEHNNVLQ
jgi:hypothetical protein